MGIIVYTSSASANSAMKKKQAAITDYLKSQKLYFQEIDLASNSDAKDVMREKICAQTGQTEKRIILAPQVFNEDEYCGDYEMFFNAREMGLLRTFFKAEPTPQEAKKLEEYKCQNIPIQF